MLIYQNNYTCKKSLFSLDWFEHNLFDFSQEPRFSDFVTDAKNPVSSYQFLSMLPLMARSWCLHAFVLIANENREEFERMGEIKTFLQEVIKQ